MFDVLQNTSFIRVQFVQFSFYLVLFFVRTCILLIKSCFAGLDAQIREKASKTSKNIEVSSLEACWEGQGVEIEFKG